MRPLHLFYALLVAAIWGGNFVAVKAALAHMPPFMFTALRFVLVAALLLPFVRVPRTQWREILAVSFTLGLLHFGLVFGGMSFGLDVSTTVIATQLGVPFSALFAAWVFNDPLGPRRIAGLVVAFIGVIILAGTPDVVHAGWGFVMVVIGALAWGISNIQIKRMGSIPIMPLLAYVALFAIPQLGVLSLVFEHDQWPALTAIPASAWAALGFTVVCSTLIGYGLWYWLLARYSMNHVTPFSLLVPFFAVAFAWGFLGEHLTLQMLIGGVVTMLGVTIIVLRRPNLGMMDRLS